MPPRLRPAADLRRPPARGGGVRRRPAARGEAGELDEGRREDREEARLAAVGTKFQEGEKVQCQKVPLEVLRRRLPVYIEGMYWGARTTLAGLVENFHVRSMTDVELEVTPQGTSEESLLKWASGHPGQKIRIHMCGDECAEKLEAEDFIHGVMIQKRSGEDPPWMSNLIEEAPRGEEAGKSSLLVGEAEGAVPGGERSKKEAEKRGRSVEKDKKKKRRREGERDKSPAKVKEKIDLKAGSKKELKAAFGATGLDPDPKYRRRFAARAQKKAKKKKKESSSDGSTSSPSSSTSESIEVFEEQQKVRRLAKRAPGLLAAQAMKEIQTSLLTATGGVWDQDQSSIQPLATQYYRQSLAPRLTGGPGREALTLCWAIDLALQGRLAECVDALVQRLKSVELVSQGSAWQIAQRLKVLPPERPVLSSRGEAKEAIKEQKEEQRTRNEAAKGRSKSDQWQWRDYGGEDRSRGSSTRWLNSLIV